MIIITKPTGEEIRIDGTKLCSSFSPEKCWEESPEMIQVLISYASHHHWRVKREETREAQCNFCVNPNLVKDDGEFRRLVREGVRAAEIASRLNIPLSDVKRRLAWFGSMIAQNRS